MEGTEKSVSLMIAVVIVQGGGNWKTALCVSCPGFLAMSLCLWEVCWIKRKGDME